MNNPDVELPEVGNPLALRCRWCGNTKHAIHYPKPLTTFEAPPHVTAAEARELALEHYRTAQLPGVCLVCPRCDSL